MPRPRKPRPSRSPTALHCSRCRAGLGAGLVQIFERRARQLELAGGLEADVAVGAGERDDLAVLLDRLPAELGQPQQQVADAAGLVPGRRAMVVAAVDELLVLGADAPSLARLLAAGEHRQQIVAALDEAGSRFFGAGRHGWRRLARFRDAPVILAYGSISRQSPATAI